MSFPPDTSNHTVPGGASTGAPFSETASGSAPADVAPADVAPADVAPVDVAPADVAPRDSELSAAGVAPLARPTCASCAAVPEAPYYFRGAQITCAPCKAKLETKLATWGGPRVFMRATLHGGVAGALGSLLYFAVLKLTGYELGLIAIVVGLLVGSAVRSASEDRGGWKYQALAIALTYCAIVTSYMPSLYDAFRDAATKGGTKLEQVPSNGDPPPEHAEQAPLPSPAQAPELAGVSAADTGGLSSIPKFLFALILLFVVALVSPFLAGFENIMGWIIIGVALYEAWKLNRREVIVFEGPVPLETAPPAPEPRAPVANDA